MTIDRLRLLVTLLLVASVGNAAAQTTAPAAPAAPSGPGVSAPPSGAPALSPTPGTPAPAGVVHPPPQGFNSTPSQSNVDLFPPSRLTTPGGPAGAPSPGRTVAPEQTPQGLQPPPGAGRPQPGGANSSAPRKTPKKTGNSYSLNECMDLWDAGTHMTKAEWRAACVRVQNRLDTLKNVAEVEGVSKNKRRR
jgi:hypothetical protein